MSKLISFETAKLAKQLHFNEEVYTCYTEKGVVGIEIGYANFNFDLGSFIRYSAPLHSELSDWLRENHRMFISITPVVINTPDDITFKGTIMYFKDCWRLAPALNNTDYDKLYEELLYKALTLIKSV